MVNQILLAPEEMAARIALEMVEPDRIKELQLLLNIYVLLDTTSNELGVVIVHKELVGFALVV